MASFSREFREQIVELHRKGGRTFKEIGKEFNLSPTTVATWVREEEARGSAAAKSSPAAETGESDKAKIRRLEKELARKEEELQILGKALAFFARRADQ
jgi:transposase